MASVANGGNGSRKGLSLHVGLNQIDFNHYGTNGRLAGCINDANAMADLARSQGFEVMNVLVDNQGTREAVKSGIADAAGRLKSGDIFFFSYSGHGSQIPNENHESGEQDDGQDETWCLYDGMLIDDEANELWKLFAPGVRVLVLLDCCHSGSGTEAAVGPGAPKPRYLRASHAKKTFEGHRAFYKDIQAEIAAAVTSGSSKPVRCSVRLISGCQDHEESLDGNVNGAFTEQLLSVWNSGMFTGDYKQFYNKILLGMPAGQRPNFYPENVVYPAFDTQKPFTV